MNRSVCRSTAVAGIVALLALCPPASVLAETRVFILSNPQTVPAPPSLVPTVTRDQALAALKRYFPVPDGPGRVDAALSTQGSHLMWQLTFTGGHGADVTFGPPAVMAEVDAHTGQVRYFLRMGEGGRPIRTGPLPAPRTEAEARDRAWLMVKEMYPAESATLRPAPPQSQLSLPWLDGDLGDDYGFSWVQYHGEVPVDGPAVTVKMDKYSLDYSAFWVTFPTLTFPTGEAKVTPAVALKVYRQALVPRLAYQPVADFYPYPSGDQASGMKLIYRLEPAGVVDAVSGRLVDASGQVLPASAEAETVPTAAGPAVKPQQLPLTNDGAMALARELAALPTGAHLEMNSSGQLNGREDSLDFFWNGKGGGGSVVVNPTTGLILHANRYPQDLPNPDSGDPAATPPVDAKQQAQARAAAIALVQHYYSSVLPDLKLEKLPNASDMGFGPGNTFFFQRYVNGIPAGHDGVTVRINPQSLAWDDISMHWSTKADFPKIDTVMTVAEASDRFFAGHEPRLVYQPKAAPALAAYGRVMPYLDETVKPQATMLVYQLDVGQDFLGYGMLDAHTGQLVDWTARPRSALMDAAKGLAGHWAEGELRYMLTQRALTPEKLNPEAPLDRADALQMLVTAQRRSFYMHLGGRSAAGSYADVKQEDSLYSVVQEGIGLGMLRPQGESAVFGAAQPITRAEFGVWLARTLKLDGLGRSELVTGSTFTDTASLSTEERNAAAFLQALGIASRGERFRGSAQLTQAEAAAFTVRLINHLSASR